MKKWGVDCNVFLLKTDVGNQNYWKDDIFRIMEREFKNLLQQTKNFKNFGLHNGTMNEERDLAFLDKAVCIKEKQKSILNCNKSQKNTNILTSRRCAPPQQKKYSEGTIDRPF